MTSSFQCNNNTKTEKKRIDRLYVFPTTFSATARTHTQTHTHTHPSKSKNRAERRWPPRRAHFYFLLFFASSLPPSSLATNYSRTRKPNSTSNRAASTWSTPRTSCAEATALCAKTSWNGSNRSQKTIAGDQCWNGASKSSRESSVGARLGRGMEVIWATFREGR